MFDTSTIVKMSEFKYWFKRQSVNSHLWEVYPTTSHSNSSNLCAICNEELDTVSFIEFSGESASDIEDVIRSEFSMFRKSRPEYYVGSSIRFDLMSDPEDTYDVTLAGAMLIQSNNDDAIPRIERCLKWLHSTDFYTAPGSTIYHNSEVKGLLKHSLQIYNKILEVATLPSFSSVDISEAIIVALSHDWCKIGLYEMYMRNVKNESTGVWESVPSFRRTASKCPFGHGTASLFIAQKFLKLSTEMALAIRWHMGHWYCLSAEEDDLQNSNENYPLVHMIQFADQLAIVNY